MGRLFWVALLTFVLIGCSENPRNVKVTDANKDRIVEEIKDLKGLTVDENRLLFAYLLRHGLAEGLGQAPPSLVDKTVGEIIDDQRAFETDAKKREDEQSRLAAEAKAKEEARAAELRNAISLTVFDKGFIESDAMAGRYDDYVTVRCAYENTSGKDIRAFEGVIRFTDLFDKEIFESSLTISDPIKASSKAIWDGSIEYNKFNDAHQALRSTDLEDMKVVWVPKSIIYVDGTRAGSFSQ